MSDLSALRGAVDLLSQFRLTDARLAASLSELRKELASGGPIKASDVTRFVKASRHYLEQFSSEANSALRDVDRHLVNAHQVVANFTAERGVLVRRISDISQTLHLINEIDNES